MPGSARVFTGVAIWRRVAAQGDAALLTGSKMDPLGADLYAFGAFLNLRQFDSLNCVEMRAAAIGHVRLLLFEAASRR